jgi:hypothetical protein
MLGSSYKRTSSVEFLVFLFCEFQSVVRSQYRLEFKGNLAKSRVPFKCSKLKEKVKSLELNEVY